MEQCKSAEKENRFVQEVTCAPEPMAVLATEQQLTDIERFCCSPGEFCILGIDPTFDLGDFSATPIVYQNLLVVNTKGQSPWVLGPILVHYKKEFRNYNFFLSTLVGLRRSLANVQAVGTDGEKSLIDAIHHQFQNPLQLRCFKHLKGNIERHLHDRKLPPAAIKLFVKDVFGADDENGIHHEGLVDCHTEDEFQIKLAEIKHLWDDLELQNGLEPQFHAWFGKYKAEDFCSSTLRGVREKAGLGCPPHPYYTNSNESMNRVIKEKTQWKKSQLPEFLDRMKELVCEQQCELEKAVIGTGEYILKERFKGLEVSQTAWSRMNEDQRLHYVKRYNRWKLGDEISKASGKGKERKKSYHGDLSPTPEVVAEMLSMPLLTVQCIWKKASDLSADSTAIAPMPGGGGQGLFCTVPFIHKASCCNCSR
jgi:hypothetical protein